MAQPDMATVLVIDDEEQIRRAVKSILGSRQYGVLLAATGEEGLDLAAEHTPSLIILDLSLPDTTGLEVCRAVREWYAGPILVLSVRGNEADKVAALDTGADDYLTKPFSSGELLARIRALLRRAGMQGPPRNSVAFGGIEVSFARRLVTQAGQPLPLTPLEYAILEYLARNANCVVTSTQLIEHVWGDDAAEDTQALRVHVSHLRKKIEPHPAVPRYLLTEPGVGFRLAVPG